MKEYTLLDQVKGSTKNIIYGDFHINQVLKTSKNKIAMLDFESLKYGDPMEDLANFVYYFESSKNVKGFRSKDVVDEFLNKNPDLNQNLKNLKDYVKKVALKYNLGSIWEFNHNCINAQELNRRLYTIEKVGKLKF